MQLQGYLLYEETDAKKNTGFIHIFMTEAAKRALKLSLRYTHDLYRNGLCLFPKGRPDFVINRSRNPLISHALEEQGIRVFNSAQVCEICNDKHHTYSYLKNYQIPCMDYICVQGQDESIYADAAMEFGYPFVIKPLDGHGGAHVTLVHDSQELHAALSPIEIDYSCLPALIFQRCASDIRQDLRVYVLGNKIVAGMLRTGAETTDASEIRANFSLGGSACLHTLTKEETALTQRIIAALPSDFIGIDFIYHQSHPIFNEIEDVVGTRMLYQYTELSIVSSYLDYILSCLL